MSGNNKASLFPVYPYDSEVEYLRNSGLAYIDIQTTSLPTYKKEICFEKTSGFTNSSYTSVTGCFDTVTLNLWFNNAACVFNYKGKENTFSINVPVNTRCVATINGNALSLEFGGSTYSYTGSAGTKTSSTNVRLFSGNRGRPGVYSIYHYKMWNDNDELILDLIPVRVGNTGYMYDRVSGKLFGNSGTGSFVLGPDKPIYDAEVEYLESTGTQYIDTKIVHNGTYKWECDCAILEMNYSDYFLMGQTYSSGNYSPRFAFGINNYNKWYAGIANKNVNSSILADKNRHVFTLDAINKKLTVDETEIEVNWSSFLFPTTLCGLTLFGRALLDTGTISPYIKARIYSSKHYDNGTLVLNLIPVRVGQVGYMYDTISHKLFGNSGTGSFIVGNDKN